MRDRIIEGGKDRGRWGRGEQNVEWKTESERERQWE